MNNIRWDAETLLPNDGPLLAPQKLSSSVASLNSLPPKDIQSVSDTGSEYDLTTEKKPQINPRWFLLLALLSQTFKGFGPGLSKYLQKKHGHFNSLTLVTTRNTAAVVLAGPFVLFNLGLGVFKLKGLHILVLSWVPAQICNFYAVRFTESYYTQLIHLSVPFFVAIISTMILRKGLPKYTIHALVVVTIGSFFVVLADQIVNRSFDFPKSSMIGVLLALTSAVCVSIGTVYYQTVRTDFPTEGVMFNQNFFVALVCGIISAPVDDWKAEWTALDWQTWTALCFEIAFYIAGLFLQILTVRKIGAPLVSTTSAWSLVVALILGASPLLGEPVNYLSIIGAVIVVGATTLYLYMQYRIKSKKEMETEGVELEKQKKTDNMFC